MKADMAKVTPKDSLYGVFWPRAERMRDARARSFNPKCLTTSIP